jgi:hypothetical protein
MIDGTTKKEVILMIKLFSMLIVLLMAGLLIPKQGSAHCDTLDGPVIQAARKALETGNVNLILIWVQEKDEAEIKEAFNKTLSIRKLSPEAKELADMYFFETLVRIHRAGEGAPYTGLKPAAGHELEPGVDAADHALQEDSDEELLKHLTQALQEGVHELFTQVKMKKNFSQDNVKAGREFVESYVVFIHYVERLYQSTLHSPQGHYHEAEEAEAH